MVVVIEVGKAIDVLVVDAFIETPFPCDKKAFEEFSVISS
jgi:hypothetical protein